MAKIDIECQQYPDLKVTVPENPSKTQVAAAQLKAAEVVQKCNYRSMSGDCAFNCALPGFAAANLEDAQKALLEAINQTVKTE